MTVKTRVHPYLGYWPNGYDAALGRQAYFYDADDQLPSDLDVKDLPNGGILTDVLPWAEYRVTDSITVTRTPPPHTLFTRCQQTRTDVYPVGSTWQRYSARITWDQTTETADVQVQSKMAMFYQSSLWNYAQGTLYAPSDRQVRQALESALLSLWAGRPRRHMNVALALIELRDVKKSIDQFVEFAKFGVRLVKGQAALPRYITSVLGAPRAISASCQKTAEAYLWYTFGVRPTVDDLTRFIREVRQSKLVVGGRKRKPLLIGRTYANGFYSGPDNEPEGRTGLGTFVDKTESGNWSMTATYSGNPILVGYPSVISPHLQGFTVRKVYGKVFAKVREQGQWTWRYFPSDMSWSCPLLRTAWELVPFSFVLDWFVDVGSSIQRLDDLSWVATTRFAFDEPWVSQAIVDTHYAPKYTGRCNISTDEVRWNGQHGQSWVVRARGTWVRTRFAEMVPERRIVNYVRAPAAEFGLTYASLWRKLIPEWQGKLKAYQISSGMALLESVAKLI